jgi:hypothetical protein
MSSRIRSITRLARILSLSSELSLTISGSLCVFMILITIHYMDSVYPPNEAVKQVNNIGFMCKFRNFEVCGILPSEILGFCPTARSV